MEKQTIIRTEGLSIGYQTPKSVKCVAKDIHIQLKPGNFMTLVGINGIGKSTLLRSLAGIQKPLGGQILLHEKDIRNYNKVELAKEISLVLTEKLPPSQLTVYELIALGRQPYTNWLGTLSESDKAAIQGAIEQTETAHLLQQKHYEISDGQLQIALVARALAQDTPVIILDEPTTHLDLQHKISVFKLLRKLSHQQNKAILFSTHDIELAIQLSDEMLVMSADQCIQGKPQDLIQQRVFDNLFKDKSIRFDPLKGTFFIT